MEDLDGQKIGSPRTTPVTEGHQHHEGENSGNRGNIAKAELHDRTGLYLAVIAVLFSAMAFGMAIVLPMVYSERTATLEARIANLSDRVQTAERESRVAQERWNDLKVELARRGIPTSDH